MSNSWGNYITKPMPVSLGSIMGLLANDRRSFSGYGSSRVSQGSRSDRRTEDKPNYLEILDKQHQLKVEDRAYDEWMQRNINNQNIRQRDNLRSAATTGTQLRDIANMGVFDQDGNLMAVRPTSTTTLGSEPLDALDYSQPGMSRAESNLMNNRELEKDLAATFQRKQSENAEKWKNQEREWKVEDMDRAHEERKEMYDLERKEKDLEISAREEKIAQEGVAKKINEIEKRQSYIKMKIADIIAKGEKGKGLSKEQAKNNVAIQGLVKELEQLEKRKAELAK